MNTRRPVITGTVLLAAAMLAACSDDDPDTDVSGELDDIRAATAQYRDVDAAIADGYELADNCVPNMGYHASSTIAESADFDPVEPNLLVYAPDGDGDLELVAVEYGTTAEDAELFGVEFDPPGDPGPPFSTLHAWVWLGNPDGTFAPLNPLVACD